MILVDSSVWIEYFRNSDTPEVDRLDRLLASEPIAVGDVILAEVLQGFSTDRAFNEANHLLGRLALVEIVGRETAVQAAHNFRSLRARGVTVRKTIDTLIATRCILDRIPLLYADHDFDPFVLHLGLLKA